MGKTTTTFPSEVRAIITRVTASLDRATTYNEIQNLFDIRSGFYQSLLDLAKEGNVSAVRLSEMMQAAWVRARTAPHDPKHPASVSDLKKELHVVFDQTATMLENLAIVDDHLQSRDPAQRQAPMLNGGVVGSALKSIEITLKKISADGKVLVGADYAKLTKGKIISPILVAGLGRKAMEEFESGNFSEAAIHSSQAGLVAATQLGLFKPALKSLAKTAAGEVTTELGEKVGRFIGYGKTISIAGRNIPIVGIIVSEVGTLVGVVARLADGDFAGAGGTFVAGTTANIAAEFAVIPGASLLVSEATEEVIADFANYYLDPKTPIKGSAILASISLDHGTMRAEPIRLDANGQCIFIPNRPNGYTVPKTDALYHAHLRMLAAEHTPAITANEQAYINSVGAKLKNDPKVNDIIADLKKAMLQTSKDDLFLEGSTLDKQLESRGVNTKSWTRY
jgi:hypothetical protein